MSGNHPVNLSKHLFLTFSDFEAAIRESCISHFPEIEPKGCSFHFCKAIISKVARNGFKGDYSNKDCPAFHAFVRAILGLCYIPILRLKEGIRNLYILAKRLTGRQRSFAIQMIKYVLRTWINGHFPPSTWVMYNHQGETTNNHSEGLIYLLLGPLYFYSIIRVHRLGHNVAIDRHPNCY